MLRGILWENPAIEWPVTDMRVLLKYSLKKQDVLMLKCFHLTQVRGQWQA
jgi:hypothetical protein